jgi:hypothetical protein
VTEVIEMQHDRSWQEKKGDSFQSKGMPKKTTAKLIAGRLLKFIPMDLQVKPADFQDLEIN